MTILAITVPFNTGLISDEEIQGAISEANLKLYKKVPAIFCGQSGYHHVQVVGNQTVTEIRRELSDSGIILMTQRRRHPA